MPPGKSSSATPVAPSPSAQAASDVPVIPLLPETVMNPAVVTDTPQQANAAPGNGNPATNGQVTANAGQAAAAPSPASVALLNIAAPPAAALNQQFSVAVTVANAANLFSAPFVLSFDPTILDFVGGSEGPLLKSDGKPTSFQVASAKQAGQVTVNLSRVGNVGGVNGAGAIAMLKFRAKSRGAASLGFATVRFTDPGGKSLDVTPFNTAVNVQ